MWITLAILVFLFASGWVIRILYSARTCHDELHFAETPDGVLLALSRYLPKGEKRSECPVILCHGIVANRFTWDINGTGLARCLADRGHDVWSLELRGNGLSKRRSNGRKISYDYNFDTHVELDLPAAIDYVLDTTGTSRVNWAGHSMGGMVLYGYLCRFGGGKIKRGCAIGSPGTMEGVSRFFHFLALLTPRPELVPILHTRFFVTFGLVFVRLGLIRAPMVVNRGNLGVRRLTVIAVNMLENLSMRLGLQMSCMVRKAEFRQFPPGTLSYQNSLNLIQTPLLLMAGGGDKLVPPWKVKHVFDGISSPEKRFIECSREKGFRADYGHCDLVHGIHAQEEIWSKVAEWFE